MESMDKEDLLAPCGINCAHCRGYLNYKYDAGKGKCIGCRPRDKQCAFLKKKCSHSLGEKIDFCYECPDFPCENLQRINRNYQKHDYLNDFVENNLRIKEVGSEKFKEEQRRKFTCPECGGEFSIHDKKCYQCGKVINP